MIVSLLVLAVLLKLKLAELAAPGAAALTA